MRMSRNRNPVCRCCSGGVPESVFHALFECPTHDAIRADFVEKAEQRCSEFGDCSSDADRLTLLMSDDPPVAVESVLYRYLRLVSASRESRLASLAAQGEVLRD